MAKPIYDERFLPAEMSPADAGQFLSVTPEFIIARIKAGEIPAYKIARQWRISKADLLAYRDGLKAKRAGVPPASPPATQQEATA